MQGYQCIQLLKREWELVMSFLSCASNIVFLATAHISSSSICIMLCADHSPCVSGAHNTIVTARAGRDLVYHVLFQGLLTIGPRFGGVVDDTARYFKDAYDKNLTPYKFVESMKKKGIRVSGIGHR
ncbi:ATP-citrate synthase beta chain protein 1 [Orobanche minor]